MSKLKLASLNVRGLKNKFKRLAIFTYLKKQKLDIICLQEAHIKAEDQRIWEKQWGGKVFFP